MNPITPAHRSLARRDRDIKLSMLFGFARHWPIRWKLVGIILALTLFGLSVIFVGMTINNHAVFQRTLARDLSVLANIIGNNSRAALLFNDPTTATEVLGALRAKQRVIRAILYDANDRVFAEYQRAPVFSSNTVIPIDHHRERSVFRANSFELVHDIQINDRLIGRLYLESDLMAWGESLRNYTVVFTLLSILTVGLTFVLALLLQRVVTGPIQHLVDTAGQVSQRRDYSLRAVKDTEDELGVLVDGFNVMLTEIEQRNAELVQSQLHLEQRVVERTAQLETVNQRLREEVIERAQAETRFRAVTETANDAIVSADHHGCVIYLNPAAERIFGYPAVELLGQTLMRIMPARFHDQHRNGFNRFLATGVARISGQTVELIGLRKGGDEFPIDLSLSNWSVDGQTYFTAIIRDISERKESEQRIRDLNTHLTSRATELETVNNELEAFSYSVSHDLRAPLRAMDGFSKAVLEVYADKLDAQGLDYLQRVRNASQRMGNLIDDMLRLSRISRAALRRVEVDLSVIAGDLISEYGQRDPQRSVDITIAPDLLAYADPALARVVLDNLLGNAWKFTGLRAQAHIEFDRMDKDGATCFFIRDNGAGFNMAYADKLFGAFQRLHGRGEFEGTGIGLATVKRVIHRHGGRVWAESAVDRGAVFYFTLP